MTNLRSTAKSSTVKDYLTDQDGNKHDAIVTCSVVTRQGGYDCRASFIYPYESALGAQTDAVIKRGTVSVSHFLSFDALDLPQIFVNFRALAQKLDMITGSDGAFNSLDVFTEVAADFAKMIDNIAPVANTVSKNTDSDVAYLLTPSPSSSPTP